MTEMIKMDLQFFGGRGAGSDLPESNPSGAGGGNSTGLDAQPGMAATAAEALGAKGRPMSTTAAVSGANPLYSAGPEYQENCQRAIIATEARFRGYDVVALPTFDNDTMPTGDNYLNNFVGAKARTKKFSGQRGVESAMKAEGDGARAVMAIQWKGGGSGHVINVVQRNGKTHYYDGQNGSRVNSKSLFNAISKSAGVGLTRVDDLPFSDTVNQSVRKRGG